MPPIDLTWTNYFVAGVVIYYLLLYVISLTRRGPKTLVRAKPFFVLFVPARNEAKVLRSSLEALVSLDYQRYLVLVMDDGSTDGTGEIAQEFAESHPVMIVTRDQARAGRGKSDVLNHAFSIVCELLSRGDSRLQGTTASDIVVGIVDADGRLESEALTRVAPYFADRDVASVQTAVRIGNVRDGLLAQLQDMEFVGFSCFVQVARDKLGSSGLGGNGQFTRLSALQQLGISPWRPSALTEDLDLGLSLVARGWRTRFCPEAYVTQQGLTRFRPLLRQRVRWIQGHYYCWKHIPRLLTRPGIRAATRLDLTLYLLLVVTVVVVVGNLGLGFAGSAGLITVEDRFLESITGTPHNLLLLSLALLPLVMFMIVYQQRSRHPLKWWEIPAYGVFFTLYSYGWILATIIAWSRMILRRNNWVKTPRISDPAIRPDPEVAA
jgi:1,2-diacylglycerol 3-beta-glucosyltransferase